MGRSYSEKDQIYNEMACEWHLQKPGGMTHGLRDLAVMFG